MPYNKNPTYIKKVVRKMKDGSLKEYFYEKPYYEKKGLGTYKDGKTHLERRKESVKCACGKVIKKCSMRYHLTTSKHKLVMSKRT